MSARFIIKGNLKPHMLNYHGVNNTFCLSAIVIVEVKDFSDETILYNFIMPSTKFRNNKGPSSRGDFVVEHQLKLTNEKNSN